MGKHPQQATLWKKLGVDRNNIIQWSTPVTINVRWETDNRQITDSSGKEIRGSGYVFFPTAQFDIGDYVAQGEHDAVKPVASAYEIKNQRIITNMSGTRAEYRASI